MEIAAQMRNAIDQRKVERRNNRSGFKVERRAADRRYADRRSEL